MMMTDEYLGGNHNLSKELAVNYFRQSLGEAKPHSVHDDIPHIVLLNTLHLK